ncbi:adenine nucleotide alpha hydrolase [Niabella beijingensis]|uniref:adenine nucleotide alpha hydrolase n=1 Tax=Niabella beijingensis TaxID=2872700 RepID=UPI001CC028BB|nr:adenine nucleotide alpha hydrolase [Niabella beijingensis]
MTGKIPIILSWSGGKDAAFCLYRLLQEGRYEVRYLLTTFNDARRSSMHEIPESLIAAQAESTGIPLLPVRLPPGEAQGYETAMQQAMGEAKTEGIFTIAFGDIFLEDLRSYREQQLQHAGMQAVFPLWQIGTAIYLHRFFESGFKAVICCINESMLDAAYCGRLLDPALISGFPATADPCGENGEYHSFCFDGPVFTRPVAYKSAGFFTSHFPAPDDAGRQVAFRHLCLKNP